MSRHPVTILMPVKNGMQYLEASLLGIQECTSLDDEIIIVDDGSSDGSYDFLLSWSVNHSNSTVLKNPGAGLVDALNYGISLSANEWIARFDVDDKYDPRRLDLQMSVITENTVAVFSDYMNFSPTGQELGIIRTAVLPGYSQLSVVSGQRLAHSSVIFSKNAVIESGMYRRDDFPAEDLGLWLRLLHMGDFVTYPEPLLKYEIAINSVTATRNIEMKSKKFQLLQVHSGELLGIATKMSLDRQRFTSDFKRVSDSRERRLLSYRDLIICSKLGPFNLRLFAKGLLGLLFEIVHLETWKILLRLHRERKARITFKKFNPPSS